MIFGKKTTALCFKIYYIRRRTHIHTPLPQKFGKTHTTPRMMARLYDPIDRPSRHNDDVIEGFKPYII